MPLQLDNSINLDHSSGNAYTVPQAAEVTEQSHSPLSRDSGITEYPILPVDPTDLQAGTISSEYE